MITFILELIKDLLAESKDLGQKEKKIIYDQVLYAVNQTKAHINSTREGNLDKPSTVISNIWQRTSKKLKEIDNQEVQNLAETIELKSKYWSDPSKYNRDELKKYNMKITQVESALDKLCK